VTRTPEQGPTPPPEWTGGPAGFVPDPRITEYPGTYLRDWIALCPEINDAAYRLYAVVRAHIWEKDEQRQVTVTQEEIGQMCRKSTDRVRKIIKPLLAVGLLKVAGKREWYEYNPATKRNERRAMNTYAVTDFPGPDYEGPKSLADFRRRFLEAPETDRSKTTGRSPAGKDAGQTGRSKTTGRSSSQVSDVSAGQTDRSKTAKPAVENDPPSKNSFKKGEGEGDARARVSDVDEVWGVKGTRRPGAASLESIDFIRTLAAAVLIDGETLERADHQSLAALMDEARPVVADRPGLSWEEYRAWLGQGWVNPDGTRRFNDFVGTLKWRLKATQVQHKAWPWACEQRGAGMPSEARGHREPPVAKLPVCGRHGTEMTADGRCLPCDEETAESERDREWEFRQRHQPPDGADEHEPEFNGEIDDAVLERMREGLGASSRR